MIEEIARVRNFVRLKAGTETKRQRERDRDRDKVSVVARVKWWSSMKSLEKKRKKEEQKSKGDKH